MSEETNDKVLSIVASIKDNQNHSNVNNTPTDMDQGDGCSQKHSSKKKEQDILRGKPKSGRFWKGFRERFSSINKTKGLKQDFQKKAALRLELKRTKELSKQALEELQQKEIQRKERRRENIKRTEENRRKSEVVQVITNTAKLKRMRKKQLRFIEKRDTNKEANTK